MRFILTLILLASPQFSFAERSCAKTMTSIDLRKNLTGDGIHLIPIGTKHIGDLKIIFQTNDVFRFYLGIHREPKPGEIDSIVSNHVSRAQSNQGGQRNSFDGGWLIKFKDQAAGYIKLTAVDEHFMPEEIQSDFTKQRSDDLYLAVGYALLPEFRGNNIVHRSLQLALNFAKTDLKAKYVFASTNNMNEPSQAVLSKVGFLPIFSDSKRTKFFIDLD